MTNPFTPAELKTLLETLEFVVELDDDTIVPDAIWKAVCDHGWHVPDLLFGLCSILLGLADDLAEHENSSIEAVLNELAETLDEDLKDSSIELEVTD